MVFVSIWGKAKDQAEIVWTLAWLTGGWRADALSQLTHGALGRERRWLRGVGTQDITHSGHSFLLSMLGAKSPRILENPEEIYTPFYLIGVCKYSLLPPENYFKSHWLLKKKLRLFKMGKSTAKDEFIFPSPMAEKGAHDQVEFNNRKESYFF